MNIQELKEALRLLANEDPEFMAEIIEATLREHLVITKESNGGVFNPTVTYALNWYDENSGFTQFSEAY